jgi:hypothetical protein
MTSGDQPALTRRRIGTIFVERGLISEAQLAQALAQQEATGQKLGEILVASYDVSRLDLASALQEQWATDESARSAASLSGASARPSELDAALAQAGDAKALGAAVLRRADKLDERLLAVETLLAGLADAMDELRQATPASRPKRRPPAAAAARPAVTKATAPTTNELLKQLVDGPRTVAELRDRLGSLDLKVLQRAVRNGLIRAKETTLAGPRARTDGEFFLTPAGATQIGEDPDQHPWPFRT